MARKYATGLIVIVVLLAGCEGAEEPSRVEPLRVKGDPHTVCSNGEETALAGGSDRERALPGDVDGDGSEDKVWLSSDPSSPRPCRNFLTVETDDRIYWAATDASEVPSSLESPTLNSLSNIDGDPGAEIVVNLGAGASTQFVGVFKLTRAGLEQMSVDGEAPGVFGGEIEGLLPYGGSVGHLEAVDCAQDGLVVMSVALPVGAGADAYEVERRFFDPSDTGFHIEKDLTEKHRVKGLKVDDFPEFGGSPFLSCD